jgi:hypothetical protein
MSNSPGDVKPERKVKPENPSKRQEGPDYYGALKEYFQGDFDSKAQFLRSANAKEHGLTSNHSSQFSAAIQACGRKWQKVCQVYRDDREGAFKNKQDFRTFAATALDMGDQALGSTGRKIFAIALKFFDREIESTTNKCPADDNVMESTTHCAGSHPKDDLCDNETILNQTTNKILPKQFTNTFAWLVLCIVVVFATLLLIGLYEHVSMFWKISQGQLLASEGIRQELKSIGEKLKKDL